MNSNARQYGSQVNIGISKAEISEDLGINANMLHRWVREQEGNRSKVSGDKNEAVALGEFEAPVRRALAKVRTERDILKKALAYFAVDPK